MNALKRYMYVAVGTLTSAQIALGEIEPGLDRVDDGLK